MVRNESFSPVPASADVAARGLRVEYDSARDQLERLMAAPVKDFPAIDALVDRLERLQLSLKAAHGIKGNNPNE